MSEIIFLAVLGLIVIGPKELPELARTLGRFLNELKRSSNIFTEDLKQHARIDLLDLKSTSATPKRAAYVEPAEEEVAHDTKPGMKFDLKPEPRQLEFGDAPVASDEDDKNQGHKPS